LRTTTSTRSSFALRAALAASVAFLAASLVTFSSACSPDETQFAVKYAPEFSRGTTVSVFGLYKDGRLNSEAWDEAGVKLSHALGSDGCPTAYGAKLELTNADLSGAVDDYTRANGVTDDLMDAFAPSAAGDTVLVFTVAGHVRQGGHDGGPSIDPQAASQTPSSMGSGRRFGGGMAGTGINGSGMRMYTPTDRNAFEMSASLFSPKAHRSVAMVAMTYTGSSMDEAMAQFVEKLRTALPGSHCLGWNAVALDAEKVRHLE
jgi:hypothetical protein